MNLRTNYFARCLFAISIAGGIAGSQIATAQTAEGDQGMEVMTRGPVHEGFAETVVFDPTPGIIVDREPPTLIEEVMPEQRPAGDNVAWISGYWGWDEDQNDFIWISGIWRNLPPGREWIPGYWAPQDGHYQWTSGYWQDAATSEVEYLPEPPRSLESGPNIAATSSNQSWVPGSWLYQQDRYAWRAGYWVDTRENWSWTPSYYRWTRRGHVYVNGYWDYPVAQRGVIFAPVHFQQSYYSQPGFSYSPLTVVALSVFTNHLFLRPSYGHYYFGDYYEPRYRDNYYASYSYNSGRRGYDPIFSHNRWENRNDQNWVRERQNYYEYRRDHADARPPRTWAALNNRSQQDRQRGDYGVAERYDKMVKNDGRGRQRFQKVNAKERERFVSQKQEIRNFSRERQQQEIATVNTRDGRNANNKATRVKVKRSPLVADKSDRSEKDGGPPPRLKERAPEKNPAFKKSTKNDKAANINEPNPGRKNNRSTAERLANPNKSDLSNEADKKGKPAMETRTKPGQRRNSEPDPKDKPNEDKTSRNRSAKPNRDKRESSQKPDVINPSIGNGSSKRQADPTPKRQADPTPKRQANPTPKRQADPTPKRQADPTPKRQADPAPKRQANPAPKRQANPTPKRQADPTPKRQADPTPKRQPDPTPKRQADPTPKRQADPTPKRQADLTQRRQADPAPKRQADSTPRRQADPIPRRQSDPAPNKKSKDRSSTRADGSGDE